MSTPTPMRMEAALDFMRGVVESEAQPNPLIALGGAERITLVPCEGPPQATLAGLSVGIAVGRLPSVDWALLMSDTYALDTDREAQDLEQYVGRLGELFEAGDKRVSEAIVVMLAAPDGPEYVAQQRYQRTPMGIVWREPEVLPLLDVGGQLIKMLRDVVAAEPLRRIKREDERW